MSIDRVRAVFRDVFDNPTMEIAPGLTAQDVDGWDSFNHINLVVALEDEFGLSFTTDQIAGMANVGDLVDVLNDLGQDVSW